MKELPNVFYKWLIFVNYWLTLTLFSSLQELNMVLKIMIDILGVALVIYGIYVVKECFKKSD
jgi:hypothetical protein